MASTCTSDRQRLETCAVCLLNMACQLINYIDMQTLMINIQVFFLLKKFLETMQKIEIETFIPRKLFLFNVLEMKLDGMVNKQSHTFFKLYQMKRLLKIKLEANASI